MFFKTILLFSLIATTTLGSPIVDKITEALGFGGRPFMRTIAQDLSPSEAEEVSDLAPEVADLARPYLLRIRDTRRILKTVLDQQRPGLRAALETEYLSYSGKPHCDDRCRNFVDVATKKIEGLAKKIFHRRNILAFGGSMSEAELIALKAGMEEGTAIYVEVPARPVPSLGLWGL